MASFCAKKQANNEVCRYGFVNGIKMQAVDYTLVASNERAKYRFPRGEEVVDFGQNKQMSTEPKYKTTVSHLRQTAGGIESSIRAFLASPASGGL
jgi:hypothetical protein